MKVRLRRLAVTVVLAVVALVLMALKATRVQMLEVLQLLDKVMQVVKVKEQMELDPLEAVVEELVEQAPQQVSVALRTQALAVLEIQLIHHGYLLLALVKMLAEHIM